MKKLLLVSTLLFCGAAYAQAPGPAPGQPPISAPLSQEEALGAEVGTLLVHAGVYRMENQQLRKSINDLTAQLADRDAKLAAAKADADSLRTENEKLRKPEAAPAPQ